MQSAGDKVNKNNKSPKDTPSGIDLGKAVYFSEGMGDWSGGGTEAQYGSKTSGMTKKH